MSAGDFEGPTPAASEQAVIGAVLVSGGEALDDLQLRPEDFLTTSLSLIFERCLAMREQRLLIDQFTVVDSMPAQHHEAIYAAAGSVFTSANVGFYADIVAAAALARRVATAGQAIVELARSSDPVRLLDDARSTLDRLAGLPQDQAVPTMREVFDQWQVEMTETVESVPTPWSEVNSLLEGGVAPGRFYVIGARPGIGKSAIALQLAHELSNRGRVLFSSLEMPRNEVIARVVSQQARVPFRNLIRNTMTDFMVERMMAWRGANPLNIAVDDDAGQSVFDVRAKARTMARKGSLAGVVVDYLQLMQDPRDLPRHEKVAEMTRALKLLSRELDVPVIACSQLNRESQRRADGTPNLSDLRESGSIEQDADVVMLLDRDANEGADSDELALILAKNRQGRPGTAYIQWQGEFVRALESSDAR